MLVLHESKSHTLQSVSDFNVDPRSLHMLLEPTNRDSAFEEEQQHSYLHSVISYGIIFGGNQPYSDKIFKIQKRVIRNITSSRTRDSCRKLFKKLEILPLYSQYIYSISIFVIKTKVYFIQTIRSTVSTQDLKPTYIHQRLT